MNEPILSREEVRAIFVTHGFTIKEGQSDLKQYVYDAAYALLARAASANETEPKP